MWSEIEPPKRNVQNCQRCVSREVFATAIGTLHIIKCTRLLVYRYNIGACETEMTKCNFFRLSTLQASAKCQGICFEMQGYQSNTLARAPIWDRSSATVWYWPHAYSTCKLPLGPSATSSMTQGENKPTVKWIHHASLWYSTAMDPTISIPILLKCRAWTRSYVCNGEVVRGGWV